MRKPSQKNTRLSPSTPARNRVRRPEHNKRDDKKRPLKREESPVMRAYEVQKILRVGKNTVYEWCKQGLIPHKRVGQLIFISRKQFYEWLENGENPGGGS